MENIILSIENLSHCYNIQWAVRDINIEIKTNGVYGLLGSNGAGKSTLMNILCGVLKQTSGNILVEGINTKTHSIDTKCLIGFLPQQPPLHSDLTVEEYLTFAGKLRYIESKDIKAAVDRVLERCQITHFRKRLIKNLSGGYQQRVGIAQAIIHNPKIVVLDEPTNGLDPNQILEIRGLIKELAVDHTVFVSTHILTEVQATCDYIFMMEHGKMVFSGTVDEFDNYILPTSISVSFIEDPKIENLQKFIPNVLSIEHIEDKCYKLKFSDAQNMTEQILEVCKKQGWRLKEIYVEKNSMNSVFAELSKPKTTK